MPVATGKNKIHCQETKLLKYLLSKKEHLQNQPDLILKEIEFYNSNIIPKTEEKLLFLGPSKGEYIKAEIQTNKPCNIFEFGSYVGYSTLMLATELLKIPNSHLNDDVNPGAKIFSFESDPVLYEISAEIIKLAGLSEILQIVQLNYGKACNLLENVCKTQGISKIELLLIDHWKYHYLPDLRLAESLGLISKGSIIIADNVLNDPEEDAAEYLEYVQQSPLWKQQYNLTVPNPNHCHYIGKFGLIYETTFKKGINADGEIDGVAITKCAACLS